MPHDHVVHAPDHVIHPLDPHSDPAKKLEALSTLFKFSHDDFTKTPRAGFSGEIISSIVHRAEHSRLELTHYWFQVRGIASDSVPASADRAEKKAISDMDSPLKKIDAELATHLKSWEEATSPFADHYDADAIAEAGRNLADSVGRLNRILDPARADIGKKNVATYAEILKAAVAGLSGEVSKRLEQLAAGRTVEMVTLANKADALVERAHSDPAREKVEKTLSEAQSKLDQKAATIKGDFPDDLVKEKGNRLDALNKLLDPVEKELKTKQDELEDVELRILKAKDPQELQALKTRRNSLSTEIGAIRGKLPPEWNEQGDLRKWFDRLERARQALKDAQTELNSAQSQLQAHDQLLKHVASEAASAKSLADYWRTVKSEVLDDAQDISKELRNALDECFKGGLADQLDRVWNPKLGSDRISKEARDVVETLENYWQRAELVLARSGEDVTDILNKLGCALTALRQEKARELQFLAKSGLFD